MRQRRNIFSNCIVRSFLVIGSCLIASCSTTPPVKMEQPAPVKKEIAFVYTKIPYFQVDNDDLVPDSTMKLSAGKKLLTFDGPVRLKIPKQPVFETETEKRDHAKLTACLVTLPICPITLLLMNTVVGDNIDIEANCSGALTIYLKNEVNYRIKLEETAEIVPVIKVIRRFDGVVIAEKPVTCETSEKLSNDNSENNEHRI